MKIFLSGANGFIGRNLAEHFLAEGQQVFPADLPGLDLSSEDAVSAAVASFSPDIIIHCANIGGTRGAELKGIPADAVSRNL